MEMWLRQTTVVLLTAAVMVLPAHGKLILHVAPREMNVSVGSCVTLSCCADKIHTFGVEWWFNPFKQSHNGSINVTKNVTDNSSGKCTETQQQSLPGERHEQKCTGTSEEYTILTAQENQTGWYFCKVTEDIPVLNESFSELVRIIVMKSLEEHTTYPSLTTIGEQEPPGSFKPFSWWIWIILGVSCLIVVVLLITCILKRRCKIREPEEPIYTNTRPKSQPSPQPRMSGENMKGASPYQNTHTPNFGRRYDNDRLRYEE